MSVNVMENVDVSIGELPTIKEVIQQQINERDSNQRKFHLGHGHFRYLINCDKIQCDHEDVTGAQWKDKATRKRKKMTSRVNEFVQAITNDDGLLNLKKAKNLYRILWKKIIKLEDSNVYFGNREAKKERVKFRLANTREKKENLKKKLGGEFLTIDGNNAKEVNDNEKMECVIGLLNKSIERDSKEYLGLNERQNAPKSGFFERIKSFFSNSRIGNFIRKRNDKKEKTLGQQIKDALDLRCMYRRELLLNHQQQDLEALNGEISDAPQKNQQNSSSVTDGSHAATNGNQTAAVNEKIITSDYYRGILLRLGHLIEDCELVNSILLGIASEDFNAIKEEYADFYESFVKVGCSEVVDKAEARMAILAAILAPMEQVKVSDCYGNGILQAMRDNNTRAVLLHFVQLVEKRELHFSNGLPVPLFVGGEALPYPNVNVHLASGVNAEKKDGKVRDIDRDVWVNRLIRVWEFTICNLAKKEQEPGATVNLGDPGRLLIKVCSLYRQVFIELQDEGEKTYDEKAWSMVFQCLRCALEYYKRAYRDKGLVPGNIPIVVEKEPGSNEESHVFILKVPECLLKDGCEIGGDKAELARLINNEDFPLKLVDFNYGPDRSVYYVPEAVSNNRSEKLIYNRSAKSEIVKFLAGAKNFFLYFIDLKEMKVKHPGDYQFHAEEIGLVDR